MTHGEPLRNLPQLRVGDDVIVETRDATYTYRLINDGDSLEVTNPAKEQYGYRRFKSSCLGS